MKRLNTRRIPELTGDVAGDPTGSSRHDAVRVFDFPFSVQTLCCGQPAATPAIGRPTCKGRARRRLINPRLALRRGSSRWGRPNEIPTHQIVAVQQVTALRLGRVWFRRGITLRSRVVPRRSSRAQRRRAQGEQAEVCRLLLPSREPPTCTCLVAIRKASQRRGQAHFAPRIPTWERQIRRGLRKMSQSPTLSGWPLTSCARISRTCSARISVPGLLHHGSTGTLHTTNPSNLRHHPAGDR
jgi:hypothetical protein